jgi:hypothetical protein
MSRANRPALYGTRAQIAASEGDVEGYLALAGCDRRAGTVSYALRIVNQSANPLRARMSCLRSGGEAVPAYPLDVLIAPYSIRETVLAVRLQDVGRYDCAVVEVSGSGVLFALEAPAPALRGRSLRWTAVPAGALALALTAGFAAAGTTPRIAMLAAPARVFAGTHVDVPYRYAGWGSLEYSLRTKDGRQLSAGLLERHEGTMHFDVPPAAGKDVILAVNLSGPFGEQNRWRHITIASFGAPSGPHPAAATPDPRIVFIEPAKQPHPRVERAAHAARVARAPMHAARVAKAEPARAASLPPPPAAVTMSLSAASAIPGEPITITINGPHGDTAIAINDSSGNAIQQGDIPSGEQSMTLTAPSVNKATTFFVMATVSSGVGEQALVKPLTVAPH